MYLIAYKGAVRMEAEKQEEEKETGGGPDAHETPAAAKARSKKSDASAKKGTKENPLVFNDITHNGELLPYFG